MLLAGDPWNKTVDTLTKKLKNRGLDGKHIDLIEDVVSKITNVFWACLKMDKRMNSAINTANQIITISIYLYI